MLAAHLRIRHRQEFRRVLRSPARAATSTLVVHVAWAPQGARAPARAGFVVGRAVGNAVTRNRVTRRLRHLMAAELTDLPPGLAVVVRALPPSAVAPTAQLRVDLRSALRRAMTRVPDPGHDRGTPVGVTR